MTDTRIEPWTQTSETRFGELQSAMLDGARASLFRWAQVVSAGRVDDILDLYAPDAILVPTLSNDIGAAEEERRRYFEFFLSSGKPHCTIDRHKSRISRKLGTVVIGGLYTFCFQRVSGEETVPARFLFTFEEIDGRWLITGHHSSRLA